MSDKVYPGMLSGLSGRHGWIEFDHVPMLATGIRVDVTVHRDKRSKDANSYFHVLVGKLADVLRESKHYIKNKIVAEYGQPYIYDGKIATYTTTIPPEVIHYLPQTDCHLWLTNTNQLNGETWYSYRVYKKTSELDSKEFSIMLDGLIRECQDMDIETMTPDELLRLQGYEKQNMYSMRS